MPTTKHPALAEVIGERVSLERGFRDQTLDEVTSHTGISKGVLSQIERGECTPTLPTLLKLCDLWGLQLTDLVSVDDAVLLAP